MHNLACALHSAGRHVEMVEMYHTTRGDACWGVMQIRRQMLTQRVRWHSSQDQCVARTAAAAHHHNSTVEPAHAHLYCLPSAAVLGATVKQLRRMQELRDSQLLEKMAVDPNEAFQGKGLVKNVLLVSHRWEDLATLTKPARSWRRSRRT